MHGDVSGVHRYGDSVFQASAVVEAKLKMSDVQTAVYLCSLIHQRYDSFAPFLLEYFQKCLLSKKDDGKVVFCYSWRYLSART